MNQILIIIIKKEKDVIFMMIHMNLLIQFQKKHFMNKIIIYMIHYGV